MEYGGGTFNGLHPVGSIGQSGSYSIGVSGRGGDPSMLVSTITHEEGHGLGMRHDKSGACVCNMHRRRIGEYLDTLLASGYDTIRDAILTCARKPT